MYILIPYYIHDKKLDIKLILITPIYLVCSVLTPYTLDGSLYIFRAFKSQAFKLSNIQELQPINFDTLEITKHYALDKAREHFPAVEIPEK